MIPQTKFKTMIYNAPKDEYGKEYWVPIVVKNKEYLVGFILSQIIFKDIITEAMQSETNNPNIRLNVDIIEELSSGRLNDVLLDGRRESTLTNVEKQEFLQTIISQKVSEYSNKNEHVENKKQNLSILNIDCLCGYGYYSWKNVKDIPDTDFKCQCCGKYLIQYTGHYDHEFIFDDNSLEEDDEFKKEN